MNAAQEHRFNAGEWRHKAENHEGSAPSEIKSERE
jgi:hypothetical protein